MPRALKPERVNMSKKILIVENGDDWRRLLAFVIQHSGFEVIEATTGPKAIDQAMAANPDLILLDLSLPEMSGIEVIKQLRMDLVTKNIPVVIETAYGDETSVRQAIKAGAREVLYKPFDLSDLPSIVRQNLTRNDY